MKDLATWLRFIGAWLVVAGSVYQASLELEAEEDAANRMQSLKEGSPPSPRVSPWWWLVPPVGLELQRRRRNRDREAIIKTMSTDDFEVLSRFVNKATGWLFVGLGATCIAAAETEALVDEYHWSVAIFVVVVVAMGAAAIGHAVARARHTNQAIAQRRS